MGWRFPRVVEWKQDLPLSVAETDAPVVDAVLVRRLIASQFPQWAKLPLQRLDPAGSDNVIYRLGEQLSVRLPRGAWSAGQPAKEHTWLPILASRLPFAVPEPVALGVPEFGYPWHWSVARWLDGEAATVDGLVAPAQTAAELAGFLTALQQTEPAAALTPGPGEKPIGGTLASRDRATRRAIDAVADVFDPNGLTAVWESALAAAAWDRPPVWFHGDMHNGNLLIVDGKLSAVIDFGGLGVGDPACDLVVGWTLFSGQARAVFRDALQTDADTWARGRGWAMATGLNAYTSYAAVNPHVAANTSRQINAVLADWSR